MKKAPELLESSSQSIALSEIQIPPLKKEPFQSSIDLEVPLFEPTISLAELIAHSQEVESAYLASNSLDSSLFASGLSPVHISKVKADLMTEEDNPYAPSSKLVGPVPSIKKMEESPPPCTPIETCNSFPWPKRIAIRHVIGDQEKDCIPFASNYTTFEILFAPDYVPGRIMPLVDVRGHRFDNNTYAANIGIGGRSIPNHCSRFCEMLGFNTYYDYRQGCIGYYQQFGLGIEVLGRRWDFRANAYVPFGHKKHIHSCLFNDYEGDFYAIRRDIESVSYSFSGEVGYLLYSSEDFLLYAAAGPYFLARGKCGDSTPGGEIRIRPQYQDYIALDLSWRHDSLFKTIWQAEIIFNLPLYQLADKNLRPCCLTDRQIYQPIDRFEVMPLGKKTCWDANF